eukprot:GFYU01000792.1.p1 GENE.GFYU01000792.1~~GFYU01000792.1.p1  ORF type:complete len:149 (-),score=6.34 GFYU01000792.1:1104-1550(-)
MARMSAGSGWGTLDARRGNRGDGNIALGQRAMQAVCGYRAERLYGVSMTGDQSVNAGCYRSRIPSTHHPTATAPARAHSPSAPPGLEPNLRMCVEVAAEVEGQHTSRIVARSKGKSTLRRPHTKVQADTHAVLSRQSEGLQVREECRV